MTGQNRREISEGTTKQLAKAAGAVALVLAIANATLIVIGRHELAESDGDLLFSALATFAGLILPAIGLLIVVRGHNVVGWFLVVSGIAYALGGGGSAYPAVGLVTHPGALPAPKIMASILAPTWVVGFSALGFMLLVFPVGRCPSPRWRPVLWIGFAGTLIGYIGLILNPKPLNPITTLTFANPLGIGRFGGAISTALAAAAWVTVLAAIASFAGLVVRFRQGGPELRQQIKWLGLAAAAAGMCLLIALGSLVACGCDDTVVASVSFTVLVFILFLGVPVAIAVAIFKYRLYELDVVVSKAVLYGLLAAFFTAIYAAVVIGVGAILGSRGNSFLTIIAAGIIAVAFQPMRERTRHLANRIVYGKRATPYEVLSEFSDRVAGTYSAEDVLPRMAEILATGTGGVQGRVWLRFGPELRPAASWPEDGTVPSVAVVDDHPADFPDGEHGAEVRHMAELLGALSVAMPASDPMNPKKMNLVRDLAAQTGLVLRNVRLIEELRASRRRIVTAQDERAKSLERNLHDGAQQQLVALAVKQRLAATIVRRDPDRAAEMLDELQTETADALENLRDLARGIYPPLLADKGLGAALEAQARKAPIHVSIDGDDVGRYPQEVEAAVYFCCLEALQNVGKYAEATNATVKLTGREAGLTFQVIDDGRGFDTTTTGYGTGLQGMADRLAAIGGTLEVRSAPGTGTTVIGRVGVAERG